MIIGVISSIASCIVTVINYGIALRFRASVGQSSLIITWLVFDGLLVLLNFFTMTVLVSIYIKETCLELVYTLEQEADTSLKAGHRQRLQDLQNSEQVPQYNAVASDL